MRGTNSGIRYGKEVREKALKLLADGREAKDVAEACGVPTTTVHYWNRIYGVGPVRGEDKPRSQKGKGSGVIAGKPYAKGLRWFGTKWH